MSSSEFDSPSSFKVIISEYLDIQLGLPIYRAISSHQLSIFNRKIAQMCEITRISGQKLHSVPILGPLAGNC